jgi:hypothetical protein
LAEALRSNKTLKVLDLSHNENIDNVSLNAIFRAIKRHPALEQVILKGIEISDRHIKILCDLAKSHPTLKLIDLEKTKLSESFKEKLAYALQAKQKKFKLVVPGQQIQTKVDELNLRLTFHWGSASGVSALKDIGLLNRRLHIEYTDAEGGTQGVKNGEVYSRKV